jgi:benzoylformate decarboxylase
MTGIEAFLDILAAAGVTHIFGNPGTTELPLNDALAKDSRFKYFFGLHEIPVTAMADGYAMASGKLGVVNVHIACGLGNAMGMLYNAHVEGTPLLVVVGQQDRRLNFGEPVLSGDLLGMAKPCTKWAADVQRIEDLPNAVRRAIQAAFTPPTGPVFLALPLDLQSEAATGLDLRAPFIPDRRVRPPADAVKSAAQILEASKNPVILAGSRVTECGACDELQRLAELLGAPVYAECNTSHGRLPMSAASPLYAGPLPLWSPQVRQLLEPHDVIFVVGMNLLRLYIWNEFEPIPPHAKIVHADVDAAEIGKNYAVEGALPGDLRESIAELTRRLRPRAELVDQTERRRAEQVEILKRIESERARRPMLPLVMMEAIGRSLREDAVVVDEAVTTTKHHLERMAIIHDPRNFFAHRGWALGWGIGCTLGVKLARPDQPVVGIIGDGAAMYGIQGLWSAAHHRIPVTFVIANNSEYKILKDCAELLPLPEMARQNYLGMDLTNPKIDFVGLSRSLGVEAHRITVPDELTERLRESWSRTEPILFDVPIDR